MQLRLKNFTKHFNVKEFRAICYNGLNINSCIYINNKNQKLYTYFDNTQLDYITTRA